MKNFLLLFSFLFTLNSVAQTQVATGVIRDSKTKETLAFTNIGVYGTSRGTVSNAEGEYVMSTEGLKETDLIVFSRMGYGILKISVQDLKSKSEILLEMGSIQLNEFNVSSKELSAKEIVELVYENYSKNHPKLAHKQRLFIHKYENTPFEDKNQVKVKESDFEGINQKFLDELFENLPKEIITYQDALFDFYALNGKYKLMPIEGISLEEGSQKEWTKQAERKLNTLIRDIEDTQGNDEIYYQFKTGIFSIDLDTGNDSTRADSALAELTDSSYLSLPLETVQSTLISLFYEYTNANSDHLEFINSRGKYHYTNEGYSMVNKEVVRKISFLPKRGGLFKGVMYVSASNYAILQLDYEFVDNKKSENFKLLGIGHAITYIKGRVQYEKGPGGYYVKYINAQENEFVSIERKFSIVKKKKRFLIDKQLKEFKMKTALFFETERKWELLAINRDELESAEFERIEPPAKLKLKKQYAYSPDMWENPSVIAPTKALKEYKRQGEDLIGD